MRPWDIIGWFIIGLFVFTIGAFVMVVAAGVIRRNFLHLKSRDAAQHPHAGQVWISGDNAKRYEITQMIPAAANWDYSSIQLSSEGRSVIMTQGEWMQRWRTQMMRLA